MTSYEFDILQRQITMLQKQIQCVAAGITTTTPPPVNCVSIVITGQPQSSALSTGDSIDLTVTATGDSPITYQWKKDGLNISGATSSIYSITNATSNDSGNYSVTLSNPCGIVNSNTVGITVTQTVVKFTAYWGWVDNPLTSTAEILALQGTAQFDSGGPATADFTANSTAKLLVMAEPLTEPQKVKWYGTDLNKGNIGTSNDLFGAPTAIGSFRVYMTNYKTQQQDTPIQFRTS